MNYQNCKNVILNFRLTMNPVILLFFSLSLSLSISLISFRNNRNNIKRQIVDSGTSDIKSEDRSKVQLSIGPIAF